MVLSALQVYHYARNRKLCSDRYRFKISEALVGNVQYAAVIKRYCREAVDENYVRLAQFMQELIDYYVIPPPYVCGGIT